MTATTTALVVALNDANMDAHSQNWTGLRVDLMNKLSDAGYYEHVDTIADVDPDEGGTVDAFRTACKTVAVRLFKGASA